MASKVQERIYVEAFLKHLGGQPTILEERESPDFLIAVGKEQFGLEVAQVFRDQAEVGAYGSPAKAMESRRNKFLRQLATDYYAAGGFPLHVKALFNGSITNRARLVKQIINARSSVPWERTKIELNLATFHLMSLPHEAEQYTRWVAINNSVGWRGLIGNKDILPRIQAKADRLMHYRSVVARVKLILVVDETCRSGMVRWDPAQPYPDLHGFDAIHLYFHPTEILRIG